MENTRLNDPDFDAPHTLDQLSPKLSFWAGIIVAMLVASTIGFFVLLTVVL